jgi:hypothetical protein
LLNFPRTIRLVIVLAVLTLYCSPSLGNEQWDFEHGLSDWRKTGTAFDRQPRIGTTIRTDNVHQLVKLKGDYWRDLPYPLGQRGNYLIFTEDEPTGTLTSNNFLLTSSHRYFSFLIGGNADLVNERLELQVLANSTSDADELENQLRTWTSTLTHIVTLPNHLRRDENYVVIVAATGNDGPDNSVLELLRQDVVEIPTFLYGRTARVRIVDSSAKAHINVDAIEFSAEPTAAYRPAVWGYGDYHTHPMSHLAFGTKKDSQLLWGSPGGAFSAYTDENLISKDIPHCITGHGRGPMAEPFINQVEERVHLAGLLDLVWDLITGRLKKHDRSGGPEFRNFPSFLGGAHQQMHITQIRRNYEGGLRLMVAYATHNRGAEYLTSTVEADGHIVPPTIDRDTVEAQLDQMKVLVDLNKDWMEIAYDPDSARRIIRQNKLAIILGIEVDQLGELNRKGLETAAQEVEYLWDRGIRVVVPIHGSDNRLGGAAVWRNEYNWLNDFLRRGKFDLSVPELKTVPAKFFEVRDGSCKTQLTDRGECVSFKLAIEQRRVVIKKVPCIGRAPFPETVKVPAYKLYEGHKNLNGLTDYGKSYIDELMKRGMIIDTAHMSDASVRDVYERIGQRLARQEPRCAGLSLDDNSAKLEPSCYQRAYPTIVSHAHFREQSFYKNRTLVEPSRPSEYQISKRNLDMMRRVGGVVGPFVTERPLELPDDQPPSPIKNDCSMSSKNFGLTFSFASQRMDGRGVGMATDFTIIPMVSPRFGKHACWGFNLASDPDKERRTNSSLYDKKVQNNAIRYEGIPPDPDVKYGQNEPLLPYRMGLRKPFDFNFDGLSHFGMVPDMLQDLKNLGLPSRDFQALFSSAESYLQMWEKTWSAQRER